ncbi:hypothetical protein [Acinetobacter baumannii]|uniref:hypothetical protein n=1 Tax=Acinetobacter baumannii TaxID=470 RepID=UPI0034E21927
MTDLNKEREALLAQIEEFKKDAMELWFVPDLAESYKNMDMFSYSIVENNEVFFMREQARQLWSFWNKAKAQVVPEGYVLVEKKNTEDWYLDEDEGMWFDHDGIDNSLCDLDAGQVQAIKHKEYLITESNTLFATKVWDEANEQIGFWEFFKTKEEAEEAATHCKAMIKASESGAEG